MKCQSKCPLAVSCLGIKSNNLTIVLSNTRASFILFSTWLVFTPMFCNLKIHVSDIWWSKGMYSCSNSYGKFHLLKFILGKLYLETRHVFVKNRCPWWQILSQTRSGYVLTGLIPPAATNSSFYISRSKSRSRPLGQKYWYQQKGFVTGNKYV